jgi:hypothetical protein
MQIYSKPEEVQSLQRLMQIRDKLSHIEAIVGGYTQLYKLSDEYYKTYLSYLKMLHEEAESLNCKRQ